MIFFTKEWANGHLSDILSDRIPELYQQNIEFIASDAPIGIKTLLDFSLNDWTIREINFKNNKLKLLISDYEGKCKQFLYEGVENVTVPNEFTAVLSECRYSEILFDEISERYVHGILLTNNFELRIEFSAVQISNQIEYDPTGMLK